MGQWGAVVLLLAAGPMGDEEKDAQDRARAALAERLEISAEAIEVLEVEPTEWPNAALGCEVRGRVYAQVLTPGYRVTLAHEGRRHWFHVAGQRLVSCPGSGAESSRERSFGGFEGVIEEARRDLAERLGLEEASVETVRVRSVTKTTLGEPGCPSPPGLEPPLRARETLLVFLRAGGETHRYRSDRGKVTYCGTP
jgi:hypothetical protein